MEVFDLIAELGLPVAGGLIMAYFIFLVMKQLMDGLVSEIQTVQSISKMLITSSTRNENNNYTLNRPIKALRPRYDKITTKGKYSIRVKRKR